MLVLPLLLKLAQGPLVGKGGLGDGSFVSWLSRMEEKTDSMQMTGVSVSLSLKPTFEKKK